MKTTELAEKTRPELLALAAGLQITGRHRMNKAELAAAITAARKKAALKKVKPKEKPGAKTRAMPKAGARAEKKAGRPAAKKITAPPASKKAQATRRAGAKPEPKAGPKRKKALARAKTQAPPPVSAAEAPHRDAMPDARWQEDVERAKYELFAAPPPAPAAAGRELPREYGTTAITVMVRDPHQAFVYWEIEPQRLAQARKALGEEAGTAQIILRVYDITGIDFTGDNARHYHDSTVNARTGSWYLTLEAGYETWCADIGLRTAGGAFHMLARSTPVRRPRAAMSDAADEKYAATREEFAKIYALSFGSGRTAGSLPPDRLAAQRLKEAVSSPGMGSATPRKK
jgi:hypothetical protein